MIGYTYTITNRNGDSFKINDHVTDPLNFIALQQYPDMDIDVKNSELPLDGQHGIWDFFSYFGKRTISFNGVVIGEDEEQVEILRTQIMRVLSLPMQPTAEDDGYVTISWEDATGDTWTFDAKMNRTPKFSRNMRQTYMLDFLISFKTDNPFILSSTSTTGDGERGYVTYGAFFPLTLPAVLGLVNVGKLTVVNDGTMYAHTVMRIYGEAGGDITNPQIENLTTGKVFKVNTVISGVSEYLEINSEEGTVVDQDGIDRSADIDIASEFILVKPGSNDLMYTADDVSRSPAGEFSVVFRSTKI